MKTSSDSLRRFLFEHAPIRGEIVRLDAVWQSVIERHNYPAVLRDLMGELCAATALLAATLKLQGSMVLQIHGKGAVKLLVVECSGDLEMRATAKWEGDLAQGTLQDLVGGDGRFVITLDPKDGNQAYQGIVALEGDSIAEILQNYMTRSEQLETRLWLAADGKHAAGMLLQKLPAQAELHDDDPWERAVLIANTLKPEELLNVPASELVHFLYHEEDIRLFDAQEVVFRCTCSRENVGRMLRMLGREEVDSILAERGDVEVHCEFCNQRYVFDRVDADAVFADIIVMAASDTRH
ncbi:Hsp33 family molecular chaperone HslO [Sideroxydans lithotrophicus]|uniref:Hsp33 protein n=1 Tax=Sideroxydans lithotrophicus (strain ES-1) TaxID=580332 RepID=D5CRH6_SIDLE|nr:Hsp33 family molecular chaperone HslO [Sideroxydans lithotrophicus]ADE11562.1 Hsp33 protein [Sideroxydans lithotrophicus ES-1]